MDVAQPVRRPRWWHPSVADAVFIAVVSTVLASGSTLTASDGDLGRHLRVGEWIIGHWRVPTVDLFSHTMVGAPFVPHEWLAEVLFALANRVGGLAGVAVFTSIVVALPIVLLIQMMHKRGVSLRVLVVLALLVAASVMVHALARPHIFTFALVVLFVALLEQFRRGERWSVWMLVPLSVLWANLHGAFVVGFVLIGTYWLGQLMEHRRLEAHGRHLLLVGVTALGGVAILNPAGPGLISNSFGYLMSGPLIHLTQEYLSPDFHDYRMWPFLALLLLTVATVGRHGWTVRILVVMWAIFALFSARNVPLFALICGPFVAEALTRNPGPGPDVGLPRVSGLSALAPVALVVLALVYTTIRSDYFAFPSDRFPVEAMETVPRDELGHVFNEFMWGGYLLYCCWPDTPVFIDGQTDFYGSELTLDYLTALNGAPGWDRVLERYAIDSVLIPPNRPLAQILMLDGDWEETYRDETAVVFMRGRKS